MRDEGSNNVLFSTGILKTAPSSQAELKKLWWFGVCMTEIMTEPADETEATRLSFSDRSHLRLRNDKDKISVYFL